MVQIGEENQENLYYMDVNEILSIFLYLGDR